VRLIFLGPPAAGKGTQARRLAAEHNMPHISTGDILRAAIREGTYLGREAKRYMEHGALVPDDVMIGIVRERLQRNDCSDGFILDGFPRTIHQAEALAGLLEAMNAPLNFVVNMSVPVEEILRRMNGRFTCKNCGQMFNLTLDPPKMPGLCNCCSGGLVRRADDRIDTVHERLEVYRQSTQPLIEYYQEKKLLKTVDGTGTIDDIAKRIIEAVSR
jgi:adenylate kinase